MKRNSIVKSIALSVTLSVVLAGCGGSSASNDDVVKKKIVKDDISSITINGKAIDGYLQYATVCLDLSQDGYCQESEPTTQTTEDGSFNLEINPDIQAKESFTEAMLLVYGGKDVDTGEDFRGKLLAPRETEVVNISPMTTLVAKAVQKELKDTKLTKEQMKEKVRVHKEKIARIFDIEIEDITKDPVAHKDTNEKLIKEALKIQKAVEAMSRASEDNDALEKVYEKLVEKLAEAEDAGGIDALLDISFADDKELLKAAKAINKNIEKSFKKFEGDLEKIAFITKKDLKKIKENRFDDIELDDMDDIFKGDYEWDSAFIKSSLEDIGIKNPTKEQIDKIKEDIDDINPRVILENIKKFEDSEDSIYREIGEKIKEHKEEEKKRRQFEKAQNDGKIVKFEEGMSFFDFYPKRNGYEEVKLGEGALEIKEYYFIDNDFEEYDLYDDERKSYILKNGNWQEDRKDTLSYTIGDNGVMTLIDRGYKVTILNQEDISGQKRYSVLMPRGSLVSILQVKQLEDQYRLFGEVVNGTGYYSSISQYIKSQCEVGHYKSDDGTRCDENTIKGESKEGKWSIRTVNNVEILVEKDKYDYEHGYASIFALRGDVLHAGGVDFKGVNINLEHYINDVAMDAYKKAIIDGKLPIHTPIVTPPIVIQPAIPSSPLENIAKGKEIYTTNCLSCHGVKGEKSALDTGAIISNNSKDDIVQLLKGYKYSNLDQYTEGALMQGQAANLSDEDIENIALYIENL